MIEGKTDIMAVMEQEGIELKRGKGLCPLHTERTPSFTVNQKRQTFRCWGCGEHGDSIDFIMKLKGYSFNEALAYLGIKKGRKPTPDPANERRKALLKAYAAWKKERYLSLCDEAIKIHALRIKANRKAPLREALGWLMAEQLAKLPAIENDLDIFLSHDDDAIFEIFQTEHNK
jgi:DNA primase